MSDPQMIRLGIYLDELLQWNKKMNLTGLLTRESIIEELLLDSLLPILFLPKNGTLLDVGSGAGFPAIPLKICMTGLDMHLMEANSKKVSFLKQVIRLTKLAGIEVMQGRVEWDSHLLRSEGYHVVTARAVADLPKTISWCAPHLKPGGLMVCFLGRRVKEALIKVSDLLGEYHLYVSEQKAYTLPGKDSQRTLTMMQRSEE